MAKIVYETRAKRGAAWLDKHTPEWWKRVNVSLLDLEDSICCVAGQLFGDYNIWEEDYSYHFQVRNGFHIGKIEDRVPEEIASAFSKMQTKAWIAEIEARRIS